MDLTSTLARTDPKYWPFKRGSQTDNLESISQMFYEQLLRMQIPKAKKDTIDFALLGFLHVTVCLTSWIFFHSELQCLRTPTGAEKRLGNMTEAKRKEQRKNCLFLPSLVKLVENNCAEIYFRLKCKSRERFIFCLQTVEDFYFGHVSRFKFCHQPLNA
jgi:hypothetical protein